MLDLTKPVRTIEGNIFGIVVGKRLDGRIIFEEAGGFLFSRSAELLENLPEPKVATALVSVYKSETGDIYLSCACPDNGGPMIKITYTEGAENPWRIEEVK